MTPNADYGTRQNISGVLRHLAERVRSHAEISARPGQYDDLNNIAETLDRLVEALSSNDGSDWQAFAQDYIDGDTEKLRQRLPEHLRPPPLNDGTGTASDDADQAG